MTQRGVQSGRRADRRARNSYSRTVLRWLLLCFPAGLMMMWGDRCRWSNLTKTWVSVGVSALILAVILPQTMPPSRAQGGVSLVGLNAAVELQGPVQQETDEGAYEVYVPTYVKPTSIIVQPTPTPTPIYVYCNQGGKYYHAKNCKYVKETSARVTLEQALSAGFKRCTDCPSPQEYAMLLG